MEPALYKNCLQYISWRDSLPPSLLCPVQIADLMSAEDHLGAALPSQYSEWLLRGGAGSEYGGLALWYHCDLTRSGNIVEASQKHSPVHREMCVFFDSLEGELFAFLRESKGWSKEVYVLDEQTQQFDLYSVDFASFLRDNVDCDENEIEQVSQNSNDGEEALQLI